MNTENYMHTETQALDSALMFAAGLGCESECTVGFAPGSKMYANMPAHQYHGDMDALSCSMLKPLLTSPAHFQANLYNSIKATKTMDFGSLVHALVLEPRQLGNAFSVYPGVADGRSREYKEFLEQQAGRLVVDEPTFNKARYMAEKILHRVVFGRPFGDFVNEGVPEATIYAVEPTTGLLLRTRQDLLHPEFTFDIKTTRHAVSRAFVRDAIDMHYDLQAFMYTFARSMYEGRTKVPFVFIAAESENPHSVHQVTAGETFMTNGAKKFQEVLSVYSACTEAGHWPDLSRDIEAEIEHWQSFDARSDWKAALGTNRAVAWA
jgi:hypothetical protein